MDDEEDVEDFERDEKGLPKEVPEEVHVQRTRTLLTTPVPVSQHDVLGGPLDRFCDVLGGHHLLRGLPQTELRRIAAIAMGYVDYAALEAAADRALDRDRHALPRTDFLLVDLMGWRAYVGGVMPLTHALVAFSNAWASSDLKIRRGYDDFHRLVFYPDARRNDSWHNRSWLRERRGESPLAREDIHIHRSPFDAALLQGERLSLGRIIEWASIVAGVYWLPTCEKSAQEVASNIQGHSTLPLREALRYTRIFSNVMPPDLSVVSFEDAHQQFVGFGLHCGAMEGVFLRTVYPDREQLLEAIVRLWHREAPPSAPIKLPAHLVVDMDEPHPFADDYVPKPVSDDFRRALAYEDALGDQEVDSPDFVETKNGYVDLGYSFESFGAVYTRRQSPIPITQVEGLLDFHAPPVAVDTDDWVRPLVPFAIDADTCDALYRVSDALHGLSQAARQLLKDDLESVRSFAIATCAIAKPVQSHQTAIQLARNQTLAWDMESGWSVSQAYPELAAVNEKHLGAYAFDFWGKDGVRIHSKWKKRDPAFYMYVALRNLGLDLSEHFDPQISSWQGFFLLAKRWCESHPEIFTDKKTLAVFKREARKLLSTCGNLLEHFDTLDSSERTRFSQSESPHPAWSHVIEYRLSDLGKSIERSRLHPESLEDAQRIHGQFFNEELWRKAKAEARAFAELNPGPGVPY